MAIIQVGQSVFAGTPSQNCGILLEQILLPCALADSSYCIWIREKTLDFSSVVLLTLTLYRCNCNNVDNNTTV